MTIYRIAKGMRGFLIGDSEMIAFGYIEVELPAFGPRGEVV